MPWSRKLKNGEIISISKTPWTEKRLETASEKKINQLYDNLNNSTGKQRGATNNYFSRQLGVKDYDKNDVWMNENPLLRSKKTEICSNLNINGHTSMELFGAMMYSIFWMYLAPVSAICTIFNYLDWASFERISRERERSSASGEMSDVFNYLENMQAEAVLKADHTQARELWKQTRWRVKKYTNAMNVEIDFWNSRLILLTYVILIILFKLKVNFVRVASTKCCTSTITGE